MKSPRSSAPGSMSRPSTRASRAAPEWLELDPTSTRLRERTDGQAADRVLARYARPALRIAPAADAREIRVCPAPSCGMFYRPRRKHQQWCSEQCGTRARVARHYHANKA
jgi:predicted RNA-binding Zn ribbon-like protein